jgi:hypothetical protein
LHSAPRADTFGAADPLGGGLRIGPGLDGVKLKTLKRGPFTLRITTLSGATKSVHSVTARVTIRVRHGRRAKTITKTVKGRVTIC